jgi:probable HAF family extracellular repeat protein
VQAFKDWGFLPGGSSASAWGVSGDGTEVVGQTNDPSANNDDRAFRWINGIMTDIGALALGDPCCRHSEAFGASSNGSVIVGDSLLGGSSAQAVVWNDGAISALPYLLPGDNFSSARAVNPDGTVIVGLSAGTGVQAVRWVNGSVSGLGFLSGANFTTARAVNSDGSVIVGYACNPSICPGGQAFRWANGTITGLGFLPGGSGSAAFGVSSDGTVVVGYSQDNAGNTQAFRWTPASGMTGLGISPSSSSAANAMSADGSVIVGYSNPPGGGAFRWTATDGARSIADLLTAAGVSFTGWTLNNATAVSSDGTVIVGDGTNPSGQQDAWIAHLPLPTAPRASVAGYTLFGHHRLGLARRTVHAKFIPISAECF